MENEEECDLFADDFLYNFYTDPLDGKDDHDEHLREDLLNKISDQFYKARRSAGVSKRELLARLGISRNELKDIYEGDITLEQFIECVMAIGLYPQVTFVELAPLREAKLAKLRGKKEE